MKFFKKILALCLACIMALGFSALADDRLITVYVDGSKINFDVNPMLENGRTLVPMRFIFEALGAEVNWDDATQTATAVKGDITISITINKPELVKNGQIIVLDVPAKLVNDRTLVPVRAVSEGMEANVEWIDAASEVIITTKQSGEYSRSQLSAADMNKLKAGSDNLNHMFELDFLPKSAIGNATLARNILSKNADTLDFAKNAWNETVATEIKNIQDNSSDTYRFNIAGLSPEDAVKKAASDYIAIAKQAGISGDDLFKSSSYIDMNNGAVMLLAEYIKPAVTLSPSYMGIVANADGSIEYFVGLCANITDGSSAVTSLYFIEITPESETKNWGVIADKDAFVDTVNSKLN